jgi:hypothetical protein
MLCASCDAYGFRSISDIFSIRLLSIAPDSSSRSKLNTDSYSVHLDYAKILYIGFSLIHAIGTNSVLSRFAYREDCSSSSRISV